MMGEVEIVMTVTSFRGVVTKAVRGSVDESNSAPPHPDTIAEVRGQLLVFT
jgi:hypothetical protein